MTLSSNDTLAPSVVPLGSHDLHVWFCPLSRYETQADRFRELLSAEEAARERRFAFPRDRRRFLLSHGLLRVILGAYAGRDPKALQFQMGAYGKPFLLDEVGTAAALRFSLSHSGDHATIAVAWVREVGVDIESSREGLNELELAQRFFSPAEARQVAEVEGETRRRLFYRYWTAKEAFLKGRGTGLAEGLQRFTVQWETDRQGLIMPSDGTLYSTQWHIRALDIPDGLVGAIAFDGADCRLQMCEWSPRLPG